MTQNSPSDGQLQGIRVQVRLLISHPPEQRYGADGREILQIRGTVVDAAVRHPEVVVRFGGQRQAELYRWAVVGKHLSVDGQLEVKRWNVGERAKCALLIEALNIYPLSDDTPDLRRIGIYATPVSTRPDDQVIRSSKPKAAREDQLRRLLSET